MSGNDPSLARPPSFPLPYPLPPRLNNAAKGKKIVTCQINRKDLITCGLEGLHKMPGILGATFSFDFPVVYTVTKLFPHDNFVLLGGLELINDHYQQFKQPDRK